MIAAANNGDEEEPPDLPGGKGELLSDPRHLRRDIRIIHRAIRDDYPIGEKGRRWIVRRMLAIVRKGGNREAVGAAMTLIAADNANIKREAMDQRDEHIYLPKTVMHLHSHEVRRATNDELREELRQIDAALAEESHLGGGAIEAGGSGEPA